MKTVVMASVLAAVLAGMAAGPGEGLPPRSRTLVGAIRWDAWVGDANGVGRDVQRSLSPVKYHFRIPFFAKFREGQHPLLDGRPQEIVDMEIHYAKTYGIDYWAILWYSAEMKYAREKYLQSAYRAGISWCHLWDNNFFRDAKNDAVIRQVSGDFKKPYYVKTADGRPVVYILSELEPAAIKDVLDKVKAACDSEAAPHPYVVCMCHNLDIGLRGLSGFGADALSRYTIFAADGIPYQQLRENEKNTWKAYMQDGRQIVPTVTTGWDTRPRYENPVSWHPEGTAYWKQMKDSWAQQGTPGEIAAHLADAIGFCNSNRKNVFFNSVILYAWNENDEGGWLTPTYFELRDAGKPLRLEAVRDQLIKYKAAFTDIAQSEYKQSIEHAVVANVFGNVSGDTFEPQKAVTQGEFAACLLRGLGFYAEGGYSYGGSNAWYSNELTYAGNLGLFGLKEGTFKHDAPINAGEAMAMVRASCKTVGKDINTYADIHVTGLPDATRLTRETSAHIIVNVMATVFSLPSKPLYKTPALEIIL